MTEFYWIKGDIIFLIAFCHSVPQYLMHKIQNNYGNSKHSNNESVQEKKRYGET